MPLTPLTRKGFLRAGLTSAAGVWIGACGPGRSAGDADAPASDPTGKPAGLDTTHVGPTWSDDTVHLTYNNPFQQKIELAWYDGKQVAHLFLGATNQKPGYHVAEQYLPLPRAAYTGPTSTPDAFTALVPKLAGYGIFDSVPGDAKYSPIWHNNWVLVPDGYQPNTLKSVEDVRRSGYQVVATPIWVNWPVL